MPTKPRTHNAFGQPIDEAAQAVEPFATTTESPLATSPRKRTRNAFGQPVEEAVRRNAFGQPKPAAEATTETAKPAASPPKATLDLPAPTSKKVTEVQHITPSATRPSVAPGERLVHIVETYESGRVIA